MKNKEVFENKTYNIIVYSFIAIIVLSNLLFFSYFMRKIENNIIVLTNMFYGITLIVFSYYQGFNNIKFKKLLLNIFGFSLVFTTYYMGGLTNLFGNWLSINGGGQFLFLSLLPIIAAIFIFQYYYFFREKKLLYFFYLFINIFLIFLGLFNNLLIEEILLVNLGFFLGINYLNKKMKLLNTIEVENYSNFIFYFLLFVFFICSFLYKNIVVVGILTIIYLFKLYKNSTNKEITDTDYLYGANSMLSIFPILFFNTKSNLIFSLLFSIFAILIYILSLSLRKKVIRTSSLISINVLLFSLFLINIETPIVCLITSFSLTMLNLILILFNEYDDYQFERKLLAIKLSILSYGILSMLTNSILAIELSLGISMIIHLIIYQLTNSRNLKELLDLSIKALIILYILITGHFNLWISILIIFASAFYYYAIKSQKDDKKTNILYWLFILVIYFSLVNLEPIINTNNLLTHSAFSLITFLLAIFNRYNNKKFRLSIVSAVCSLLIYITTEINSELSVVILVSYLYYVLNELVVEKTFYKDLLRMIVVAILLSLVLFLQEPRVMIISLLVTLVVLVDNYYKKNASFFIALLWLLLGVIYFFVKTNLNVFLYLGHLITIGYILYKLIKVKLLEEYK